MYRASSLRLNANTAGSTHATAVQCTVDARLSKGCAIHVHSQQTTELQHHALLRCRCMFLQLKGSIAPANCFIH